jgi:hypothetical protein
MKFIERLQPCQMERYGQQADRDLDAKQISLAIPPNVLARADKVNR